VLFSALGALVAWLVVGRRSVPVQRPERVSPLVRAAREDLYGNAINEAAAVRPTAALTRGLVTADRRVVDGFVNGVAGALGSLSERTRRLQTGFVRTYALSVLFGGVLLVAALMSVGVPS